MSVLDTHESRTAISRHVREGMTIARDRRGRWRVYHGFYFVCPRCDWRSRAMRAKIGATRRGELHALACPDPVSESRPGSLL